MRMRRESMHGNGTGARPNTRQAHMKSANTIIKYNNGCRCHSALDLVRRESDREGRGENRGNHMYKQDPKFEEAA